MLILCFLVVFWSIVKRSIFANEKLANKMADKANPWKKLDKILKKVGYFDSLFNLIIWTKPLYVFSYWYWIIWKNTNNKKNRNEPNCESKDNACINKMEIIKNIVFLGSELFCTDWYRCVNLRDLCITKRKSMKK